MTLATDRRPRVGLVCQPIDGLLPPPSGSIAIWVYETAQRLAQGYKVTVYMRSRRPTPTIVGEKGIGYKVVSDIPDKLFTKMKAVRRRDQPLSQQHGNVGQGDLGYAAQVALHARRSGIELLHVMNFFQFVPVIRRLHPRCRIVLNMHCEWLTQLDEERVRSAVEQSDLVIGCSEHITRLIEKRFPWASDKLATVYNGVSEDLLRLGKSRSTTREERQILFVGRVSPEKGIHTLVEAMPRILERVPSARLRVVGALTQLDRHYLVDLAEDSSLDHLAAFYQDGDKTSYHRILNERIHDLGLEGKVEFAGSVPFDAVIEEYRTADLVVNPSLSESFGRSVLEALAAGVPVVCTRIGGMPEIVEDGATGIVVEPEQPELLAEAISRLLSDETLRLAFSNEGRQAVSERFAWSEVGRQLGRHYQLLTAD